MLEAKKAMKKPDNLKETGSLLEKEELSWAGISHSQGQNPGCMTESFYLIPELGSLVRQDWLGRLGRGMTSGVSGNFEDKRPSIQSG